MTVTFKLNSGKEITLEEEDIFQLRDTLNKLFPTKVEPIDHTIWDTCNFCDLVLNKTYTPQEKIKIDCLVKLKEYDD